MSVTSFRKHLEHHQVKIYFAAVVLAALVALAVPGASALEIGINPALALMLFVTFLQVPFAELGRAFANLRFLAALLVTNFLAVPILAVILMQFLSPDPMVRFGVLLVLLAPCIDYVVTFAHIGAANARLLLAATPALLIVQMLVLPVYLNGLLGGEAAGLVQTGPFMDSFAWLIAVPLLLAALVQLWARDNETGARAVASLGLLPVPATALVLFVVVAAVAPQLAPSIGVALRVAPIYVAFAIAAPLIGWAIGLLFRLDAPAGRVLAFSAATRNSLVVLPLAFAVPGAVPVLPAIIVTQTLIELISELIYMRLIPKFGSSKATQSAPT